MSEYPNGAPMPNDPQGAQPTQVQPTQVKPMTPPVPGTYSASGANASANGAGYVPNPGAAHAAPNPAPAQPESKPKKPHVTAKAVVAGLLGGVIGAGALTGVLFATGVVGRTSAQLTNGTTQSITIDPKDEDTTVANAVAAKALPSVASVYCTYENGSGMGSGVIFDTDGNIITNNHVIEDAQDITVTINGKSYNASLVGTDPSSDLAVIKADLDGDTVTPMELGKSADLKAGDWVMSVGSPFGLESSVSQGIVSALYRSTLMQNSSGNTLYTNLIQVDAAINPGNSGGALVNDEGKLVGICTLFSSDTESFAGIGFAIPGDYAVEVAQKIIAGETVTHAYIGLSMQTVNARNAEANDLSVNYGAYVAEVTPDSPADKAGIKEGDVLVGIGNTEITSADGAILAVRSHSIGETVPVTVMRGSQQLTMDVTLGSDEALQEQQNAQNGDDTDAPDTSDGISLEDLERWYNEMMEQREQDDYGRDLGRR